MPNTAGEKVVEKAELTYRRRLPHLRVGEATYFITWRLRDTQTELSGEEREVVASALRSFAGTRYHLIGFVVMNDHVHVIVQPIENHELTKIVQSWKSYTGNRLQRAHHRKGAVWGREYFDRVIRDECELSDKIQYVLGNPQKRWPEVENYQWAWIADELV
jgi:REP element-mobilizing transposase RayT